MSEFICLPHNSEACPDCVKELVRLEQEIVGYKAQVAGQAHYIKCLLDEVRELKERIAEFVKGA